MLEKILQRAGIDIARATLAGWMIQLGALLEPVIEQLRERLLAYDIVQMDETRIQVLKEPQRSASSNSYIWVQRGGPPAQPIVLFSYDPSRGQAVAKDLLAGFSGYLQSDGFEVYAAVAETNPAIRLIGCFAHYPASRFIRSRGLPAAARQGVVRHFPPDKTKAS